MAPPRVEGWLHEIKFDGWRIQLHKHGGTAAAFTKDGHDRSGYERGSGFVRSFASA
jgi:ATP-dependent DNA ligase